MWLIITILAWSFLWKLLALWKSARKNQIVWFIVLALVNTVGILEILYIYIFSETKKNEVNKKKPVKRTSKSKNSKNKTKKRK
jgi:methionyl-tRNA synthetase